MSGTTLIRSLLFCAVWISACNSPQERFTIWIGGSPQEVDYWQSVVDRFNKRTGYDLLLVRQPTYTDQRKQNLLVSLAARQGNPDLFLMDVVWISQFARSGWLMPLDTGAAGIGSIDSVFFPSVIRSVDIVDSALVALPVFLDVALLYYRADLLTRFGYHHPPGTWEELRTMSVRIQSEVRKENPGFNGFVWQGAQYEGLVCSFNEFISSSPGAGEKNLGAASEGNISSLQYMHDLIHRWKISPPSTYTEMKEEEVRRSFQSGNALFERNWTYAWNLHQQEGSAVREKTGIALLPHFAGGHSVSTLGGWHIAISRFSDRRAEAEAFIRFAASFHEQQTMLRSVGWNPSRMDLYTDSATLAQIPRLSVLADALSSASSRPTVPYYGQLSEIIQRNVNDCLAGKTDASAAMKNIEHETILIRSMYE